MDSLDSTSILLGFLFGILAGVFIGIVVGERLNLNNGEPKQWVDVDEVSRLRQILKYRRG